MLAAAAGMVVESIIGVEKIIPIHKNKRISKTPGAWCNRLVIISMLIERFAGLRACAFAARAFAFTERHLYDAPRNDGDEDEDQGGEAEKRIPDEFHGEPFKLSALLTPAWGLQTRGAC